MKTPVLLAAVFGTSLTSLTQCEKMRTSDQSATTPAAPARADQTPAPVPDETLAAPQGDAADLIQQRLGRDGSVRLKDGDTFRLSRGIVLGDGQSLSGAAVLVPEFDLPVDAGLANAAILIRGRGVLVEGVEIRKPFVDGSYGIGVAVSPGSRNVAIRGVSVSGYSARYGILAVESSELEISGCEVRDFMMDAAADMIADSPAGICLKRCTNAIVSHNRIFRIEAGPAGRASISPLRPDYGPQKYQPDHIFVGQCQGVAIVGNVMETSGEGIDVLLSSSCTISGNVIRDIWFQGIKMLGVSSTAVSGNFLSDCYQGIGLATHGAFNAECENNAVTGNVILNTGSPGSFGVPAPGRVKFGTTAGIYLHDTARNNIIANNVIRNTAEAAIMTAPITGNVEANLLQGNSTP